MTEHPENELQPTEADRLLDLYLAALPRFEPRPGFADRVMSRLAVAQPRIALIPAWRIRIPQAFKRPALHWTLAGSAAASSTVLTALVGANVEAISATVTTVTSSVGAAAWQGLLVWLATWSASAGTAVGTFAAAVGPVSVITVAAALSLALPLSTIGMMLVLRPAMSSRKRHHAVR
jgi:hypothetical protein